uniref:Uncharacterized protein n=1 Tax=Timema cristinae TaxID=61476 RepID=A0A7R9H3K7_TIMCR|nr:unnamed protein product [Timema cristinae]
MSLTESGSEPDKPPVPRRETIDLAFEIVTSISSSVQKQVSRIKKFPTTGFPEFRRSGPLALYARDAIWAQIHLVVSPVYFSYHIVTYTAHRTRRVPQRGNNNNNPHKPKSQKQLHIEILQALNKIQKNQNEQKKQMRNFSRSLEEMKKIQQQCSDSQSDVQHKQQQLLETHQDIQKNFQHLPQTLEQMKHDILLPFTKQEPEALLEVANYTSYTDDDNWKKIVNLLECCLKPESAAHKQLEEVKKSDRPLFTLCDKGYQELLELLLDHGMNVDKLVDGDDFTFLHWAARRNCVMIVRRLLQRGANADCVNRYGSTPLHYSTRWGNVIACKSLVEAGCNVRLRNSKGYTALDWARRNGPNAVVQYLDSVTNS